MPSIGWYAAALLATAPLAFGVPAYPDLEPRQSIEFCGWLAFGAKCPDGECCGPLGICGTDALCCGVGCQSSFGRCGTVPSQSSALPSALPSAPPSLSNNTNP